MNRSTKIGVLVGAVVLVLLGAGFGLWWFVLRDDAPPPPSLAALETGSPDSTSGAGNGAADAAGPQGAWRVAAGDQVFVGYRIQELFAGDTIKKDAVGRTPGVSGTMTITGDQVTAVEISADMQQLSSDQARRDATQRSGGLEINSFPTATFRLTEPITLPTDPQVGATIDVVARGDLTLHGVTRSIELPLQAGWTGDAINIVGSVGITLADYQITPPKTPAVGVDDHGMMEVQLRFVRA